jgi:2-hydroxy-6-oxonona-2,4-dienedioate hydrolase
VGARGHRALTRIRDTVAGRRARRPDRRPADMSDLVGSSRLWPRERFAVRRGLTRWAATVAVERRTSPAPLALRGGAAIAGRMVLAGGHRLHVRAGAPGRGAGAATPALLVHGVIVSSRYLVPLGVELAADRPVLVPDLPGYGLSEPPPGRLSLAALADAVIACADAEGHERVALVANSFGAQVSVEAALRHPERVERLVLLGPTVDPAARSLRVQYARWQRCAPDEHLSVLAVMARDLVDVGALRALRLLRIMLDDAIEAKLPDVRCPALVVRGGRDRVCAAAWSEQAVGLLPRGEVAVVPGYAHMAHYSGVLAVAPIVRRFLAG